MPERRKRLTITLDSLDVAQLLEGLQLRAESWRQTADFIDSGYVADDSFVCEDCNDASEAARIAEDYERIIAEIERQMDLQRT